MSTSEIPTRPRRIAVVTSSRADYGHLYWVLREIRSAASLELQLIVTGAHLSATFGQTDQLIEADGFQIDARVPCLDMEDSGPAMARTIGNGVLGMTEALTQLQPDLLLLIADRHEMLAPAAAALALRLPIAHIEGGDISEGAIDDAVRNALTKMSHLHFTPTAQARRRVLAMGEESWRVTHVGAPSIDHLLRSNIPDLASVQKVLGQPLSRNACVVATHPVTLHEDTTDEAEVLFEALKAFPEQIVFCFPNADAGYTHLVNRARHLCNEHPNARLYVNLDHLSYWGLIQNAGMLVGNSSSGIMETASVGLPTVDIGTRQQGRTRPANVIHARADANDISRALHLAADPTFRRSFEGKPNPYGDGQASARIVSVLVAAPGRAQLLLKQALPLHPRHEAFLQAPSDTPAVEHS